MNILVLETGLDCVYSGLPNLGFVKPDRESQNKFNS